MLKTRKNKKRAAKPKVALDLRRTEQVDTVQLLWLKKFGRQSICPRERLPGAL